MKPQSKTTIKQIFRKRPGTLPSDQSIASISVILTKQSRREERDANYAPVKEVLSLLGSGVALSAAILVPKSAKVIRPLMMTTPDWDSWKHFNVSYLQRTLRRLEQSKAVEVTNEDGKQVVRLTVGGKRKILKYSIDTISSEKPKRWDHKWRLVLYDIPNYEKTLGDAIRQTLRNFGFYPVQESVYLYPYPCFDQVEFLRQYYGLGSHIQYMVIMTIENDQVYKTYFNLA
jgi:hypothetical protein